MASPGHKELNLSKWTCSTKKIRQQQKVGVALHNVGVFSRGGRLSYRHGLVTDVYAAIMTSSNGNIFRVTGVCARNSPVTGEFPSQRPVTRSFDGLFHLRLNKRLSKRWRPRRSETPSRSSWRHCNGGIYIIYISHCAIEYIAVDVTFFWNCHRKLYFALLPKLH